MALDFKLITSDESASLADDGYSYELVQGELVRMGLPEYRHGKILVKLSTALEVYGDEHAMGDVLSNGRFKLHHDPDTVLSPDIAFVSAASLAVQPTPPIGYPEFLPDLVFEVVSPSDSASQMQRKVQIYLEAGVGEVLVVWPETRTLSLYKPDGTLQTLAETDELNGGTLLPGFRYNISKLFR